MRGRVRRSSDTCPFREQEVQKSSFFLTTHYRQMARGFRVNLNRLCLSNSSHLLRFIPFFSYPRFTHSCPRSSIWRFSARRRLVTATQRCSFGENTDGGHHFSCLHLKINERMQTHQKGIGIVLWGESFCFNNQSFENQDFGKYVFICIVCHGRAGDSISSVPCTCLYKLIKIPCPLNFLRPPCFFIICGK